MSSTSILAPSSERDRRCAGPCVGNACGPLIGTAPVMRQIYSKIDRLAAKDVTVVITGESGTGKELVARSLHNCSPRHGKPFVAINCAALADTLLESELFGHERGAFTGAFRESVGKIVHADGGTLFLDEIGSMSPACQAKLLRALETRQVEPVGGHRSIAVDFRLVTATNEDLAAKSEQGGFRRDLYHRLWVANIHLPPLRERREDIPVLVSLFVEELSGRYGVHWTGSPDVIEAFTAYAWPGNVRELRNVVEQLVALSEDTELHIEHVPEPIRQAAGRDADAQALSFHERVRHFERGLLVAALAKTGGNKSRAARDLKMSRENFLKKLHRHGLATGQPAPQAPVATHPGPEEL